MFYNCQVRELAFPTLLAAKPKQNSKRKQLAVQCLFRQFVFVMVLWATTQCRSFSDKDMFASVNSNVNNTNWYECELKTCAYECGL